MKLYILIAFSVLLTHKLPAQNFEETINFADNLFRSGDLTSALKAYQRALYFSEGRNELYLFRQIAEVSYLKKDYESAQKYFGLAYNQSDNDSLSTELLFQKAGCHILNANYQFALIDLLSVNEKSPDVKKRLDFYMATCYYGLEDFENAMKYFESCLDDNDIKDISVLFSRKNLLSPSPKKARVLSMIIPGLGQAYSGDIKSGLNSLVLTSGLIALFIKISVKYQLIDAIVTIMPWYQRYYSGGYGKAEQIAIGRRQTKRNNVYNEVLRRIDENVKN